MTRVCSWALLATLVACGRIELLDAPTKPSGAGGTGGTPARDAGVTARDAGVLAPDAGVRLPDAGVRPPPPCGCKPSRGVDVLDCGSFFDWGRELPLAVLSPDGSTIVFEVCAPSQDGVCNLATAVRWTATEGASPIATNAWVEAISADGHTVVLRRDPAMPGTVFVWRDGQVMDLPLYGTPHQFLTADGGKVIGTFMVGGEPQVASWTPRAGIVTLGTPPGAPTVSWPRAINADASVIVGDDGDDGGPHTAAFLWTARSGSFLDLGNLAATMANATAQATSDDGSVVAGWGLAPTGRIEFFGWTAAGGMTPIAPMFQNSTTTPYFFRVSPPLTLSRDGAVMAGTAVDPADLQTPAAFTWDASSRRRQLLTPGVPSLVRGMSARGDVILGDRMQVNPYPAALTHTPFVWSTGLGPHDLAAVLASAGVDLDGLVLGGPVALAADGKSMVGQGSCGGATVLYRAIVPALSLSSP